MKEVQTQVREWGRSLGVVIPKDAAIEEHIKPGDTIKLLILKKSNPLKRTFNSFKFKKSTKEMLEEADMESWDE
ncbi:MAG: AbrB/MazE/SpoVT family DNA-binding domain-containing protein [Candidatus Aenigmarchaeota archaeon]|nr:AbrB/MazE/SpoVT family DNA-binding domain-containing protein [Candidatus Aenigmarchaeota archaeon]